MEMTFFVSIPIDEAIEIINKKVDYTLDAQKLKPYKIELPDGNEVVSVVYRRGQELTILVVMDTLLEQTRVHLSSNDSDTMGLFFTSVDSFPKWIKRTLNDYIVPESDRLEEKPTPTELFSSLLNKVNEMKKEKTPKVPKERPSFFRKDNKREKDPWE